MAAAYTVVDCTVATLTGDHDWRSAAAGGAVAGALGGATRAGSIQASFNGALMLGGASILVQFFSGMEPTVEQMTANNSSSRSIKAGGLDFARAGSSGSYVARMK